MQYFPSNLNDIKLATSKMYLLLCISFTCTNSTRNFVYNRIVEMDVRKCHWVVVSFIQTFFFFFWPCMFLHSLDASGSRASEPARWSFHQRKTTAKSYSTQNSGNGPSRHPTLCDLQTAAGLTRLRVQDPLSLPGDRFHSSGSDRWK